MTERRGKGDGTWGPDKVPHDTQPTDSITMATFQGDAPPEYEPSRGQHETTGRQHSYTIQPTTDSQPKPSTFHKFKKAVGRSMAGFFLGEMKDSRQRQPGMDQVDGRTEHAREKWRNRSLQLHTNKIIGGAVKPEMATVDTTDSVFESASPGGSMKGVSSGRGIYDPLHRPGVSRQESRSSSRNAAQRQWSHVSTASSSRRSVRTMPRRPQRKDSVVRMAYDGIRDWVTVGKRKKHPVMRSRSFAPGSVTESAFDDFDAMKSPTGEPAMASVDSYLDDVFFDTPTPTSAMVAPPFSHLMRGGAPATPAMSTIMERSSDGSETTRMSQLDAAGDRIPRSPEEETLLSEDEISIPVKRDSRDMGHDEPDKVAPMVHPMVGPPDDVYDTLPIRSGWRIGVAKPLEIPRDKAAGPDTPDFLADADEDMPDGPFSGMSRIGRTVLDTALDFDNSNRRELGRGIMGRMLDLEYRKDRMNSEIAAQIDAIDEHRPYFTYWVTFVQVVIYIISVSVYGIAPIGFEDTYIYGEVLSPNLAIQVESYIEKDNLWIGPRQADLIHLGAKYSPCMRKDQNVEMAISWDRGQENLTACCIRNDGSGCVQLPERECSDSLSKWYSWTEHPQLAYNGKSGLVCGTDPRKCREPLSQGAFEWNNDITEWPICVKRSNVSENDNNFPHLTCKIAGRPCCIGIQGECVITTREYCEFRKGFFHEEAFLCSQVSCMNEICGMIEFLDPKVPDQFYRLWTSLFLHAGLLQLLVSLLFQIFIMRDMEKLAGWLRLAIIYIGSGIAGSLSSAIFLPYHVEAGPAGSQFGVLAMYFAEVIQNFYIIRHPWRALGKLTGILLGLFVLGLLPYIDNYAHLIGFLFGFLLSFALLPYITFNKLDRRGKIIGIVVCLITACGLFALLIVLFYVIPVYNCPYCHYFNCIPFTPKFCESMKVEIRRTGMQV